jgi:hypothetical protein
MAQTGMEKKEERKIVWNIGPVNEYGAQSAIITFVRVIIRK